MVYITGSIMKDWRRILPENLETKGYHLKKGDILISLGSVGIPWINPVFSPDETNKLDELDNIEYTFCFIDGNHENFDFLESIQRTVWYGGYIHRIGRKIVHLMRGQVFNIEGKKFLTFGGGESTDFAYRKEHLTWWKNEKPSMEEFGTACGNIIKNNNTVDYILTHEVPLDSRKKDTYDKIQTIMHHTAYKKLYCNKSFDFQAENIWPIGDELVKV